MDRDELNRFWYVKAGLRERWKPLGHTVLYGEHKNAEINAIDSEVQLWGAGIVQEIDAAHSFGSAIATRW